MVVKKIFKKIKNNSIIFLLSIFLAFSLFYVNKNETFFQASVLSTQDINFIKQKQRDIAYKNSDGIIDIFVSEDFLSKNYESLNISIIFDKLQASIQDNITEYQNKYKIDLSEGRVSLYFEDLRNINHQESLIVLPFSGLISDSLISDAFATKGLENYPLSVGNLTQIQEHTK
ncbi:hypothetical protein K9M48_04095 [Candidatus Gracilibacteria bacterium]|nr:hypothetical protein [Candidatus Gracilibacteria bacterium]